MVRKPVFSKWILEIRQILMEPLRRQVFSIKRFAGDIFFPRKHALLGKLSHLLNGSIFFLNEMWPLTKRIELRFFFFLKQTYFFSFKIIFLEILAIKTKIKIQFVQQEVFFFPVKQKKKFNYVDFTKHENFSRKINFLHLNALKVLENVYICPLKIDTSKYSKATQARALKQNVSNFVEISRS